MLELNNIRKTFNPGTINEKKALCGVNLHLNPGDFVTIIGGNGAGKSTTLNAVAGVWPIDSGDILIDGVNVNKLCEHKRAKDLGRVFQDPMNGTAATGTSVKISNGTLYIYCNGDGIDSNSRTAYEGIAFEGGKTVVISNSNGNSAIDTEQGYRYSGGNVIALMPRGGMTSESTHCQNFGSIGASQSATLAKDQFLTVSIGSATATLKMPCSMTGTLIILGSNAPSVDIKDSSSATLNPNGVAWN